MKYALLNQKLLHQNNQAKKDAVEIFYENTTKDYQYWSKKYNMHFGYYQLGLNPLQRESMLENMNKKIMHKLHIEKDSKWTLIGLGCGMGATMRYICNEYKNIKATGYTITKWQVKEGNKELKKQGCTKAKIELADITKPPKDSSKVDYAIAMESICHTPGTAKTEAIKHLSSRLKIGGKFVISDAFALKKHSDFSTIARYVHHKMCTAWELPTLANINEVCESLKKYGFGQLKIENISWRVAPSVLHVPFAIGGFLLKNWLIGKDLNTHSIKNLKGSFATFLSSLCMNEIGYCIISGEKLR